MPDVKRLNRANRQLEVLKTASKGDAARSTPYEYVDSGSSHSEVLRATENLRYGTPVRVNESVRVFTIRSSFCSEE